MIHLLRTEKSVTILTCEVTGDCFNITIDMNEYSKMLLWIHSEDKSKTQDFINDFSDFGNSKNNFTTEDSVNDFLKSKLREISTKWNFVYSTDN